MNSFSDEKLFQKYKRGDFHSFLLLKDRYKQRIFNLAFEKTNSTYRSKEVLNEVFSKLHLSRFMFSKKYKLNQWLYVLTKDEIEGGVAFAGDQLKTSKEGESLDFKENLKETAEKLSDRDLELMHMRFSDGLALEEIAHLLNLSKEDHQVKPWLSEWEAFKKNTLSQERENASLDSDLEKQIQMDLKKFKVLSPIRLAIIGVISLLSLYLAYQIR